MTSIAQQTEAELGGRWSVLVRQRRDHVELDRLLDRLSRTGGSGQEVVLQDLARLVFPHAYGEETVLWPQVRRLIPDGHELTVTVEQEHQEINALWSRLDAGVTGSEREELLERLTQVLREDVRDEEDHLLLRLQEAVSPSKLRLLGVAWEAVRRTAPTRPHPVVSRRPPGNAVVAVPLALLDRTRDYLDTAARQAPASRAKRLVTVSARLGSAGQRLERRSWAREGEDASTRG